MSDIRYCSAGEWAHRGRARLAGRYLGVDSPHPQLGIAPQENITAVAVNNEQVYKLYNQSPMDFALVVAEDSRTAFFTLLSCLNTKKAFSQNQG